MKLLLIRHADPDYTVDGLTEVGKIEAELLSERLAPMEIAQSYVSTMGRAKLTAAPTLAKTGKTAIECDWLREFNHPILRPDREEASACPWDWLPQDWLQDERFFSRDHWFENERMQAGGIKAYYDEVVTALDQVLAEHGYRREKNWYQVEQANNDTLAFFCHFGVACVLMSHLMNVSPMILWQGTSLPPSSVTTIYTEERRPGIASFRAPSLGDISHLYAHGREPSFSARFCEVYGNGERVD